MNGGAWLTIAGDEVNVILRDLDVVEHWHRRAEQGEFEVDLLGGYLAGIPSYTMSAELESCRVLHGSIGAPYPPRLQTTAPPWWRLRRCFSLDYARMHARRTNIPGASGQAVKALMEEAMSFCVSAASGCAMRSGLLTSPVSRACRSSSRRFPTMLRGLFGGLISSKLK